MPKITVEDIVVSVAVLVAMFIGMRLIYGYWPWQRHPAFRRARQQAEALAQASTTFDFQPVPPDKNRLPNGQDHFDRNYGGNDNEAKPPGDQQESVADPKKETGGKTPTV